MLHTNLKSDPVLYILMRNDLPSLNFGKGMAQAAHAGNALVENINFLFTNKDRLGVADYIQEMFSDWSSQTNQGFGTTIVLGCDIEKIYNIIKNIDNYAILNEIIVDPTYPYIVENSEIADLIYDDICTAERIVRDDGKVVLFREEKTCAYIFGDKTLINRIEGFRELKLHP